MNRDEFKNDPIIQKWEVNYNKNFEDEFFVKENTKPFSFLLNTKPYIGKPCVLVVAGPAIDKNIQNLKNYQKTAIILAADVILFKLLENDIKPDFVVNIDPSEMFVRFWNDLDTSDLTLICPTTTHPDVLNSWNGRFIFFNQADKPTNIKGKALKEITKKTYGFGTIVNKFFIGATLLQVAYALGLKPAILIGYDFAYTDGKAYCDGFLDRKIYDDTFNPGTKEHTKQIEKLKSMEIKGEIQTKDIYGNFVETSKQFDFYRNSFIFLIRELRMNVINSTEGGILWGIKSMNLKDSLEEYCKDEIIKKDVFELVKRKRRKRKK